MITRVVFVRRGSTVLLFLWLVGLSANFAYRKLRANPPVAQVETVPPSDQQNGQPVHVQSGVTFSDTAGAMTNLRGTAAEIVEFESGWQEYRDVQVSLYRQGEVAYGVVAKRVRLNQGRHEAEIGGDPILSLQSGIAARANRFFYRGGGSLLESDGTVTFAGSGWGGIAAGINCNLVDNTIEMVGGVSINFHQEGGNAPPGILLMSTRVNYDRKTALFTFPEGLTVYRQGLQAQAGVGSIQLAGEQGGIRKVTLAQTVRIDGTTEDGGELHVSADSVDLEADQTGGFRFAAKPALDTGWVSLLRLDPVSGWRLLTTWRLVGEASKDSLKWLEGQELVCAQQWGLGNGQQSLEASRVLLDFTEGRANVATASGNVHLDSNNRKAIGTELKYSFISGTFVISPSPGGRVTLSGPELDALCDQLEGKDAGDLTARGQTSGSFQRNRIALADQGGEATYFAADAVTVANQGDKLVFEGQARIWQKDQLLRADHLDFLRSTNTLTGKGNVITTTPTQAGEGSNGSVTIRAKQLIWSRAINQATYEGDVQLEDNLAIATCQRLEAETDSQGKFATAKLEGGVELKEKTSSRVLRGERAFFSIAKDMFELWGNPVIASEPSGNQIKSDYLQWRRASDMVVVKGSEESPSETMYHPSKATPTPKRRGGSSSSH